jgi:hypothetical protein
MCHYANSSRTRWYGSKFAILVRRDRFSAMSKRPQFPTPIQDIAINLTFAVMGERRVNRTYDEYMAIAARLPPLKVLTFKINQLLQQRHKCNGCNGFLLPQLCRFKAGDQRITYEPYPKAISYQTVRTALEILGMREPRWQKATPF